jgi:hypothetical protein
MPRGQAGKFSSSKSEQSRCRNPIISKSAKRSVVTSQNWRLVSFAVECSTTKGHIHGVGFARVPSCSRKCGEQGDRRRRVTGSTISRCLDNALNLFRQPTSPASPASPEQTATPVETFGLPVYNSGVVSETTLHALVSKTCEPLEMPTWRVGILESLVSSSVSGNSPAMLQQFIRKWTNVNSVLGDATSRFHSHLVANVRSRSDWQRRLR